MIMYSLAGTNDMILQHFLGEMHTYSPCPHQKAEGPCNSLAAQLHSPGAKKSLQETVVIRQMKELAIATSRHRRLQRTCVYFYLNIGRHYFTANLSGATASHSYSIGVKLLHSFHSPLHFSVQTPFLTTMA